MPIIPRTPPRMSKKDCYDKFIDIYFNSHIKVQNMLIKTISDYVQHPVYSHLLNTMEYSNAHYIIGYLRSQKNYELYTIIENIVSSPLPPKDTFYDFMSNR